MCRIFFLLVLSLWVLSLGAVRPKMIATEKIIATSPCPDSIYLYTPAIVEGFDGRFVVAVDYGGPGTAALGAPRSDFGDKRSGNQIRVYLSDNRGKTWRESKTRLPMMHEILFKSGKSLYMVGHSGRLLISRSDDNGETWSTPSVLWAEPRWHQSCCSVDIHKGKVTLVYEKWLSKDHAWPGVGPVLMQARVGDDLTLPQSWKFSPLFNPDSLFVAAKPSGIPAKSVNFPKSGAGMLETNVVRIYDKKHPFYDPEDKTVALLLRANTGFKDIGVMLKGVEKPDGSLAIEKFKMKGEDVFYVHIPGGNLKFHLCYDAKTKLYWMVHSQIIGGFSERRRLALSYSPDLLTWCYAGMVAIGPSNNGSRHYATMMISGDDLFIVSRSGDKRAKSAHDNNLTTFHRIKHFRDLVVK